MEDTSDTTSAQSSGLAPLPLIEDRSSAQLAADGDADPDETEADASEEELDAALAFGGDGAEEVESEFITGHVEAVTEQRPEPRRATARVELPREHEPLGMFEDEGEDGEGEDAPFDEDGDEDGEVTEEDALFNLSCAAIERGAEFDWSELVVWLVTVEVDDPRLALVATLLAKEGKTAAISGERVLVAMKRIGLGELVEEARQAVAEGREDDGDEDDDAEPEPELTPGVAVRTSASALRAAMQKPKAAAPPARKPGLIGTPDRRGSSGRATR